MIKLTGGVTTTRISQYGNSGWTKLEHTDEPYTIILRPLIVESQEYTLTVDDWSKTPICINKYKLSELTVDAEWHSVYSNPARRWERTQIKQAFEFLSTVVSPVTMQNIAQAIWQYWGLPDAAKNPADYDFIRQYLGGR